MILWYFTMNITNIAITHTAPNYKNTFDHAFAISCLDYCKILRYGAPVLPTDLKIGILFIN